MPETSMNIESPTFWKNYFPLPITKLISIEPFAPLIRNLAKVTQKKHPELVGDYMKTAAMDFDTCMKRQALDGLSGEVSCVSQAISGLSSTVWRFLPPLRSLLISCQGAGKNEIIDFSITFSLCSSRQWKIIDRVWKPVT